MTSADPTEARSETPANDNPGVTNVHLSGPATDGTPGNMVSYTYVDGSIDIAPIFTGRPVSTNRSRIRSDTSTAC